MDMIPSKRQHGFSLMETLMAVGTLAIGMMFIAGSFLTGVYLSTVSTERTIAAVAADEAFAKVQLYGLDPNQASLTSTRFVSYEQFVTIPAEEYLYPSTREEPERQYSWAAICRRMRGGSRLIQCTVFVSRQIGTSSTYWVRTGGAGGTQLGPLSLPRPVPVLVMQDVNSPNTRELLLQDALPADGIDELAFVNDGAVLVDDRTGQIYRVLERYADQPDKILLDLPWTGGAIAPPSGGWVWVVPPATAGGRDPLVGVYQQVLRFPEQ
ncbi:MAG: hypothetical protein A2Y76_12135 [Planctomycetes bacterium RBG_13_60_9]|nr:MAG: hypothetical protein A2Y76_12135 [Planctomycetes bacterium RBG_13_60_9]